MHHVVLLEINGKNSGKMARNVVFMTTKSFGFMNLGWLRFWLSPNNRKTDRKVSSRHNTSIQIETPTSNAMKLWRDPSWLRVAEHGCFSQDLVQVRSLLGEHLQDEMQLRS